jgi:N-glycosidase YbiA
LLLRVEAEMISSFTGRYRFLSNFYPSPIRLGTIEYPTVEHAFQALKSHSQAERRRIAALPTPGQAKRAGRLLEIRPDWDSVKVGLMATLIEKKFQDPELRHKLLDTGVETLIEGNEWGDTFWGVCRGEGQNILGKLLMETRRKLK